MGRVEAKGKWAVILCGGFGSRMGGLTREVPKSLIEVHGKPILWYTFWTLHKHGFRNFVLPVGFKGAAIAEYFDELCSTAGCQLFARDTGENTPIAERISQVMDLIPNETDFLLLNGDTIFDFDIGEMHNIHKRSNSLVTLSSVEIVSTWGLILMQGDKLVGFDRQRKIRHVSAENVSGELGLINSGIAWINKSGLSHIDLMNCGDFETTFYQHMIDIGRGAHYVLDGYWYPIDTPKDLQAINIEVEGGGGRNNSYAARKIRDDLVQNLKG